MIGFHFFLLRLRAPDSFCRVVGSHYDRYPHASSGQWWHDCLLDPTLKRFQWFLTKTSVMHKHPSLSNIFNFLGKTPCISLCWFKPWRTSLGDFAVWFLGAPCIHPSRESSVQGQGCLQRDPVHIGRHCNIVCWKGHTGLVFWTIHGW